MLGQGEPNRHWSTASANELSYLGMVECLEMQREGRKEPSVNFGRCRD
jgi:hypothetical protein